MKKNYNSPLTVTEKIDGHDICLKIDDTIAASGSVDIEAPERDDIMSQEELNAIIEMNTKDGWNGGLW